MRREVYEEAGVTLSHVLYHSSQPWPCGPSPQARARRHSSDRAPVGGMRETRRGQGWALHTAQSTCAYGTRVRLTRVCVARCAQLMLGALGIADTDEVVPNLNEVADARWGGRAEVAEALEAVRGPGHAGARASRGLGLKAPRPLAPPQASRSSLSGFVSVAAAASTGPPEGALTLPAPEAIAHQLLAAWVAAPIESLREGSES